MTQRTPILFWLLLAATLSVDAVVTAWIIDDIRQPTAITTFIAMGYAQVSILSDWAVLAHPTIRMRWVVPFGVGLAIALIITLVEMPHRLGSEFDWQQLLAFTSLMWVHVAAVCLFLWLLKPTRLFANYSVRSSQRSWRFTTIHLLILLPCLPLLIIVFKNSAIVTSGITARGIVEFVAWVFGNTALLIAIAVIVQRTWMWVWRLAACAGAAMAIGLFLNWAIPVLSRDFNTVAFSLIQALVIWAWLETLQPRSGADIIPVDEPKQMEAKQ
jgi:hypothetical protein